MDVRYGGFWRRWLALMIDVLLAGLLLFPLVHLLGLSDEVLAGGLTARAREMMLNIPYMLVAMAFLYYGGGTPGKLLLGLRVVDADTLGRLSGRQAIGRQLAYILSLLPFFLGFLWIAFDGRKLAGTVVIHDQPDKGLV